MMKLAIAVTFSNFYNSGGVLLVNL